MLYVKYDDNKPNCRNNIIYKNSNNNLIKILVHQSIISQHKIIIISMYLINQYFKLN